MKRMLIIIGVMCVIAGAVSVIGGFAAGGWNIAALDPVPSTRMVYDSKTAGGEETFEQLNAVGVTARGRVRVKRGATFAVEYSECEYFRYDVSYEQGQFRLDYVELKPYGIQIDLFGAGSKKFAVEVTLPQTAKVDVSVETENGSVGVEHGAFGTLAVKTANASVRLADVAAETVTAETQNAALRLENVTAATTLIATTSNGSLTCDSCQADDLRLATKNGTVKIYGGRFGEGKASTTNSSVRAYDLEVERSLRLDSNNGSIRVEDATMESLEAITSNATVKFYNVKTATLVGKSTNGAIRAEDVTGDDITLTTTNGSVKGTICAPRSAYTVISSTDGSNNLTNGGSGDKKLTVTTTNSSIKFEFVG